MDITLETKVADMLDAYPFLEDVLIDLNPHFENLRNPILRNSMAKIAPLRHAADVAGIDPNEFIDILKKAIEEKGK